MLTYIYINFENDPRNCGVKIQSFALKNRIDNISKIVISRKEVNSYSWKDIHVIDVNSVSDLTFECLDILTLSGKTYSYNVELMSSSSVMPIETELHEGITTHFEGLFVGDFEKYYVAGTNYKTETKRNMQVEYVTTLSGRYPFRISNADTNYTTGTSSGLFLKLDSTGKSFIPDDHHEYSNEVLDFLCDGNAKILKTHDGQAWYVSIDGNPNKVYSEFYGMNALQFNWTEIGELPTTGMVGA